MKKTLIILSIVLLLSITGTVYAAVPSPTSSASQIENSQINQLKNKIASQVSQLNLVEKRGIFGTIQAVTNTQITLLDIHGQIRYVDLDEITKYESTNGNTITLTDVKKGDLVSVLGIYNKDSERILARFVSEATSPTRYYGEITDINTNNDHLTILTDDQKLEKISITNASTIVSYNGGTTLNTYGFSKLSTGDRVDVIGYPDKSDSTLLVTDRLIDYLNAPKDPDIILKATPTPGVTIVPKSSKGAKSISPIK